MLIRLICRMTALAALLALEACGAPLYSSVNASVPTTSGNGRVRMTNVGGMVVSTEIENPPGMIEHCLRIRREWNDYLIRSQQANTENVWVSWLRQASLANAANECMNYATYGAPMPAANGSIGAGVGLSGPFNNRWH